MSDSVIDFDSLLKELDSIEAEKKEDLKKERLAKLLESLPENTASEYFKKLNPYGTIADLGSKSRVILSCTNMRMPFAIKLAMNAIMGFERRALEEWEVPTNVVPIPIEEYMADPSIIDKKYPKEMLDKNPEMAKNVQLYKDTMRDRLVVKKFLDSIYEFNPHKHAGLEFKASKDAKEYNDKIQSIRKKCIDASWLDRLEKFPKDTFYRVENYLNDHYEQLRETVTAIHGIPDDVDLAVIVHDKFESEQKAIEFKQRYAENFKMETMDIPLGKVVFLGPYRKNRDKIEFYSDNTQILKSMLDQRTEDMKFATDVLKKRVKRANAQAGKDTKDTKETKEAKNFVKKTFGAGMRSQGGFTVDEDEEPLEKDLIEIPIHKIGQGGLSYEKELIYNKAEGAVVVGGEKKEGKDSKQ